MAAKFLNLACAYRYPVHLHKPHKVVINLPKYISVGLLYVFWKNKVVNISCFSSEANLVGIS